MYKIRFTPYRPDLGTIFDRQMPGHRLVSRDGKYCFLLDDAEEADFWVVQGKGVRTPSTCHVAPENTILLTTEPRSVLVYPDSYLRQFGLVCTCQERTRHPHVVFGPAILPWFVGYVPRPDGSLQARLDYDMLEAMPVEGEKPRLLSVITSNKAFTQGHLDRIRFVRLLQEHFGDKVDVFGRGFRDFEDKWDVLRPYRYHIAIENSSQRYYWTEKICDPFLAGSFPFYYGCTHLEDYFPRESFLPIDISQPERAIDIIEAAIREDRYHQSLNALAEAKRRVLEEYNMFEYAARLCDGLNPDAEKRQVTIRPCRSMMNVHNFWNYTFTHNYYKLKARLCGITL